MPRKSKVEGSVYDIVVAAICEVQILDEDEIWPQSHFVADLKCDTQDMVEIQYYVENKVHDMDLFDDLEDGAMALMTVQQFVDWIDNERRKPKRRRDEEEVDVVTDSD